MVVHICFVAVRLHLGYCIQCGALPYRQMDKQELVQRKGSEQDRGLRYVVYEERLRALGL